MDKNENLKKSKENNKQLAKAKQELRVAKEDALELKKQELEYDLKYQLDKLKKELEVDDNMTNAKLMLAISNPNLKFGIQKKYSAEELMIIFQKYKELVAMLSELEEFVPSKENFSAFAGISTVTYNQYKVCNDPSIVETMEVIDDYIKELNLEMSQKRRLDSYTTIFRMKASHGMVEAQPVTVVEHRKVANKDKIKEQLNNLKNKPFVEGSYEEI